MITSKPQTQTEELRITTSEAKIAIFVFDMRCVSKLTRNILVFLNVTEPESIVIENHHTNWILCVSGYFYFIGDCMSVNM